MTPRLRGGGGGGGRDRTPTLRGGGPFLDYRKEIIKISVYFQRALLVVNLASPCLPGTNT